MKTKMTRAGQRLALKTSAVAALGVAGGMALLQGCGKAPEAAPTPLRTVRTVVAESGSGGRMRTFSGTSQSSQKSRLSFKVPGTLVEVPISVGDRLRKGQVVARLDPFQYELEAERAQADLKRAQAALRNAASTYERTKELYANNNASRTDLDSARANAESAEAQVRSAEKQLELARLNISYTRLTAAVDCSVASVDVEVNENVGNGSTVATVNCGQDLEVNLSIPGGLIGELREGMTAEVSFDAVPGETFTATLTEVGIAASSSATFPATLSIIAEHSQLRPGMTAEARFAFASSGSDDVILLPLTAVIEGSEGSFVYLAEPGEGGEATVSRRNVELGELTERGIEILSGIEAGDLVITAGTSVIREGMRVRLPS